MKFFTEDIIRYDRYDDEMEIKFKEACRLNHIEYLKARKKLPKKFVSIYEKTGNFDDALVPVISIVTENNGPSKARITFVDCDNHDVAWEVIISNMKEMSSHWRLNMSLRIDSLIFDELHLEDKDYFSWEMQFSDGLNMKIIFKDINIRQLSQEEIKEYFRPKNRRKRRK